jgi:hypothetical protein
MRNTHNEEVLTLQARDILESALNTGSDLTLVLIAASRHFRLVVLLLM